MKHHEDIFAAEKKLADRPAVKPWLAACKEYIRYMMMKTDRKISVLTVILALFSTLAAGAQTVRGTVTDAETGEPVVGATVVLEGTLYSTSVDMDGTYLLKLPEGSEGVIAFLCVGYKNHYSEPVSLTGSGEITVNALMYPDNELLDEVVVAARKNSESEAVLRSDRRLSTRPIENIGAMELEVKGISNAADAVETMTGVSFNTSGQIFVRGLGDRYSLTTLNGIPIASPNPDNKLIPLEIFSTSMLKSITVSKVYSAVNFADYSGAIIDIATKENIGRGFLSVSFGGSGRAGTTFGDFYKSDRKGWLLQDNNLSSSVKNMNSSEFASYIKGNDPFGTNFNIRQGISIPMFSGSISGGYSFSLKNGDELSLLASVSLAQDEQTVSGGYIANLNAQGDRVDAFDYDGYTRGLDLTALLSVGYLFRNGDDISFNLLYTKNATDEYKRREGFDAEDNSLIGSNSVGHSYSLWNNQLAGRHRLAPSWNMEWKVSYGMTESNEPDRRQVMYRVGQDGSLSLFKLNRQETMRYFGELSENEVVAQIKPVYSFGEKSKLYFGAAYKYKSRDYNSMRFYYNLSAIDPEITDIYTPDFLNPENIFNGTIPVTRDAQPKNNYYAAHSIIAGFAEVEYYPIDPLLLSLGVRYEFSRQEVVYWTDAAMRDVSVLQKGDFFPAVNVKYDFNRSHALRFAASLTVTRPSFIEMAPFLYKESYGSAEIRGNKDIQNGYNYNLDLKYEYFSANNRHMFSAGVYYKILQNPIERVQESSGGSMVYSFRNAERGDAAGFEAEFRTEPVRHLIIGGNVSLMYTDVRLMEDGGIYTDSERALQGASPYLGNLFVTYAPEFRNGSSLSLSLMYNVQGPRIHTVGTYGLGNVEQQPLHLLDANIRYRINGHWGIEFAVTNLLDTEYLFLQEVPSTGEVLRTESYRLGQGFSMGVSYDF